MKEKIDGWLAVAGLEVVGLIAGGIGASVALFLAARTETEKKLSLGGKAITWLVGTMTAAYVGPLIILSAGLPARATAGVIFFVGLSGLSMAEALIKQMPDILKALRIKYLGG